jgi:hypothetical protein
MAVFLLRIRNIRNRPTPQNVSSVTRFSTSSGNSEGIQRRHLVRKAKLLSTVAAALLLSAGAASAQGMSKDSTPERAPAAQQNAPAEKVAPSMKGGEHKPPQTTGQATPNTKSGKARETTGQSPKSEKSDMDQHGPGSAPQESSPANGGKNLKSNSENSSAVPSTKSTTEGQRSTTTGQGAAAGSAKLTTEQRTKITSIIRQHKVERVNLNVSVNVGTRIPANVHLYPLPQEVIVIYPEWRGYDYILVGDQIVIINPRTHEIVAIVEA